MALTFKPARWFRIALGISSLLALGQAALVAQPPPAYPEPYAPAPPQAARGRRRKPFPLRGLSLPSLVRNSSSPPRSSTRTRRPRRSRPPRRRRPIVRCRSIWLRRCICRMPGRWSSPSRKTASNWRRRSFSVPRSCGCRTSTRASTTTITKAPTSQPTAT